MKSRVLEGQRPTGLHKGELIWAVGSLCMLHQRPFTPELMAREFPPPHTTATLIAAARSFGFRIREVSVSAREVDRQTFPLLVSVAAREAPKPGSDETVTQVATLGIITAAGSERIVLYRAGSDVPEILPVDLFESIFQGTAWLSTLMPEEAKDPDAVESRFDVSSSFGADEVRDVAPQRAFGFGWFVPELLRHREVWRDVLLASLCLQLIALVTPLCTQIIIDKVVVHRTQATLITIAVALLIFTLFSTALSWIRQYLVLHTGNRVDAVLGAAIWEHLLKLPLPYFHRRPTGVVAARLHGVETIREFISGAAVTLVLDLPFLVICIGVMLYYSVHLTALSVAVLALIAAVSVIVAPIFQRRMNDQFLLGARNQAFVTEHIAGFETVKSLQMEPQLRARYSDYLAAFLNSGFKTRQIGNTYSVFANTLEQVMTLGILLLGAWVVMTEKDFTIGRLVAFQMFAGKLSQPVMRLTGLWSQFQQARLSTQRLGDLLDAPVEAYGLSPQRPLNGPGRIEIDRLAFRYAEDRPLLYENLSLTLEPGRCVAIMGPSGAGKSTLAKLLMGFYRPSTGSIRIDDIDTRHMAVNELRSYFGVVPQETILFSGTIYDNLRAGNPAVNMEQVVQAARMAGIHTSIEALPKGYQTEVGERGAGLSGGQKQRLAIARALLKGPKVLVFDEATSALDGATADTFAKTINSLHGRVTMLFITHALPRSLHIDEVWQLGPEGVTRLRTVAQPPSMPASSGRTVAPPPAERKASS